MKEKIASSWQDFEKILESIEHLQQKARERQYVSELFYRGQADSRWRLETTLERTVSKPVGLADTPFAQLCLATTGSTRSMKMWLREGRPGKIVCRRLIFRHRHELNFSIGFTK